MPAHPQAPAEPSHRDPKRGLSMPCEFLSYVIPFLSILLVAGDPRVIGERQIARYQAFHPHQYG